MPLHWLSEGSDLIGLNLLKPSLYTNPLETRKFTSKAKLTFCFARSTSNAMPGLWSVHDNPSSRLCRILLPSLPHLGPRARDFGVYTSGALVPLPSLSPGDVLKLN